MMRREGGDGTPSVDEVEHDFTVPADADLRPAPDTEDDGDGDDS